MRGKRTATPERWRVERAMPSNAISKTCVGSTARVGPKRSFVCRRTQVSRVRAQWSPAASTARRSPIPSIVASQRARRLRVACSAPMPGDRRAFLAVLVLLLGSYAYVYQAGDQNEAAHFDLARALAFDRTTRIDAYAYNTGDVVRLPRGGETHVYSNKAPGTALVAAAPLAAWHAVVRPLVGEEHVRWHVTAYLTVASTVGLLSALAGAATLLLLRRLTGDALGAFLAVAAIWLGSPVFPFSTMLFSHALAGALLAFAFAALLHAGHHVESTARPPWRPFALAGGACGLAVASEYPTVLVAACLTAYGAHVLRRWPGPARLPMAAAFAGSAAVFLLLLLVYNAVSFGHPLTIAYQAYAVGPSPFTDHKVGFLGVSWRGLGPFLDVLLEITVRPYRGLLHLGWSDGWLTACSPVLWLALPGLVLLARERRAEAVTVAAAAVLMLAFNASYGGGIGYWGGGATVGARHLVAVLPLLALPLALAARRFVVLFVPLLVASVFWMLLATVVDPRVPYEFGNPWSEYLGPSWRSGRFSASLARLFDPWGRRHEGTVAQNLARLAGLPGPAQIVPLGLFWTAWALTRLPVVAPGAGRGGAAVFAALALVSAGRPLLTPRPATSPLVGRYFANATWSGVPVLLRRDPWIDFDWHGATERLAPLPTPFSAEWSGDLHVARPGLYRFAVVSDEAATLELGARTLVANTGAEGRRRGADVVYLTAGWHPLRLRWANVSGGGLLHLLWTPPRWVEEVVPPDVLRDAPPGAR